MTESIYESYLADFNGVADGLAEGLRGKNVFVTGANGLIGSCLADLVLCCSRKLGFGVKVSLGARRLESLASRFEHWDGSFNAVRYDAMRNDLPDERFDYVFHCASNAHPVAYAAQPVETAMTNVMGMYNLLSKLASDGGSRMVYVSSSEVYGARQSADPYKEGDCFPVDSLNPRSCYPASKRLAENLCAGFASEHGVDSVIVRPGHVFGPMITASDSRAHAQFARNAAAGQDIVMKSPGLQFRSYCYAVDCASAMLFAALRGVSGEAYNIANPDSDCTIADLAEAFAEAAGTKVVHEQASALEQRGYNLMDNSALDSSKLCGLGWRGMFDLQHGASRTVELLRAGCFA